jgi:hypothetical protein
MANRVAEVNKALKQAGAAERLTRGNGYYYFRDGNTAYWPATSVYVFRADALSVADWIGEYETLKGESR